MYKHSPNNGCKGAVKRKLGASIEHQHMHTGTCWQISEPSRATVSIRAMHVLSSYISNIAYNISSIIHSYSSSSY